MRILPIALTAVALAAPTLAAEAGAVRETGFLDRALVLDGRARDYQVFVPRGWTPERAWPVVLFLHGAGERGADGRRPTEVGIGSAIRRAIAPDSAVVVFPQADDGRRWFADMAAFALAALDSAIVELHGDPDRIYLTGASMGGQGAWFLARAEPARFAAIATVCGRLFATPDVADTVAIPTVEGDDPYAAVAAAVRDVPAWVFHSADDPVVPVEESRRIVEALRALGADPRYTEYADAGHGAWERAYADPELWRWLFAQRRGAAAGEP